MTDKTNSNFLAGLDTASDVGDMATTLAQDGYSAIGRYYSKSTWKQLTSTEAEQLIAAGLSIFVVYQDSNDSSDDFSATSGEQQALRALYQADAVISQPKGSGIYFAVDYNASMYDFTHYIRPYFAAINEVFSDFGNPYKIGIYGNGLVCAAAKLEGLASLTWLSQSTSYYGYQQYKDAGFWNILQGSPVTLSGTQFDNDTLNSSLGSYGGFDRLSSGKC
ncbi:DUF1906 domain-containing protein [Pseudovibrio sp. Tun.PSC04-5.I4]|uniref:DUF1906 domain-containing protein n=1 Tax=Pseudovibrio sp. Tun.PSC04-5.I4 TaxID=1798213 RepID=UPI00087F98D1|nr:DUF1906 domain-containing protein [Pseudovibrio sp. Tun.PSC04-5.I4]SDQ87322.1 protein of unknown function [Pseudovibrio sp. Tun.PSC04-5.I4]